MRFGKESVAALVLPERGEEYVFDTECPQLAVRMRPGGKTYVLQMWDKTRRRSVRSTLGKTDALTPDQARAKARGLVTAVSEGQDVRRPVSTGKTLRELVNAWHLKKSKSKRTADEMRDLALDHLGRLADRPVSEIERQHIADIHHHLATVARRRVVRRVGGELARVEIGEPGIPATADKWLAVMSSVFRGEGLAVNPCQGVQKAFSAKESARQSYLHGEPLLRFWTALQADPDAAVRDVLLVALFTGQRKGNVLAMRWDHIDLDAGLWTIPGDETKQRKSQTNPLSAQVREILDRRRIDAANAWVFPAVRAGRDGEMGHMSETRPRDAWERITQAAGIEGVRIHDLRHTAGSWLARLGSNEAIRQKALGHQTSAMSARYTHLELDPVAAAMQQMGDAITAAATKPRKTKGTT